LFKQLRFSTRGFEIHIWMLGIMWAVHWYLTITGKEVNHTSVIPLTAHKDTCSAHTAVSQSMLFEHLLNYIHVLHDPSK